MSQKKPETASLISPPFKQFKIKAATGILGDALELLNQIPDDSIHAIVTDPPYGIKEYHKSQLEKRKNGKGGIWRLPPSFDGSKRAPLPRFTALTNKEKAEIGEFFTMFSSTLLPKLLPGAHLFIATNSYLSQIVYQAIIQGGLEFRGEVIRVVQTLRGGDRPKNAEKEFADVCSMPKGSYEPWGLFRKAIPEKMTVAESLRNFKTGGLRRKADGAPFSDLIYSERTPKNERAVANHPSLKPQSFMRQIVYSALPLGEGIILDPFMGAGSTLAAANFCGYDSLGFEMNEEYYEMARASIPLLSTVNHKSIGKGIQTSFVSTELFDSVSL